MQLSYLRYLYRSLFLFTFLPTLLVAETLQLQQYRYDQSGNIVGVLADTVTGQPAIDAYSPLNVPRGEEIFIEVQGQNLFGVKVNADNASAVIRDVVSESDRVSMKLLVPDTELLGPIMLSFSNQLGADQITLTVVRKVIFSLDPPTIALSSDGTPETVTLGIDIPSQGDLLLTLSVDDPSIATLPEMPILFPSGTLNLPLQIQGLNPGEAKITLEATEGVVQQLLGSARVGDSDFSGLAFIEAWPVGVQKGASTSGNERRYSTADPVGVRVGSTGGRAYLSADVIGVILGSTYGNTSVASAPAVGVNIKTPSKGEPVTQPLEVGIQTRITSTVYSPVVGVNISDQ